MSQLLLLAAVIAALVVWQRIQQAPKEKRDKLVRQSLIWGAVGLVVILALTGKLHPLFAAAAAMVPLLQRGLMAWKLVNTLRGGAGGAGGPSARSRHVVIELDHGSGRIDGRILEGTRAGSRLSSISTAELLELASRFAAEDPQSQALIHAYLDYSDPPWRQRQGAGAGGSAAMANTSMSRQEACEVLGVTENATPEQITAAHRALMQKLHPDRGGSTYLAAKVNLAKQVLIGKG